MTNKTRSLIPAAWLLTLFVGIAFCHADKPNIVIIYADDMGYGDCTAYNQGYATNMIGKWHLGFDIPPGQRSNNLTGRLTGGPLDRGFDYFHGNEKSGPSSNPIVGRRKATRPIDKNQQNRLLCDDVVRIIKEHAASDQSKPLFLYYALLEPHAPQEPEEEFRGRSQAGAYGDYVVQLDH